jgi:hypothetical protein
MTGWGDDANRVFRTGIAVSRVEHVPMTGRWVSMDVVVFLPLEIPGSASDFRW